MGQTETYAATRKCQSGGGRCDVENMPKPVGYAVCVRYIPLLWPCFAFACAETPAAQVAADGPRAAAPSAEPTHGVPETNASIGDVTCSSDADCVVTNKLHCCACCNSRVRATSRAWLNWRDQTECPKRSCKPCGKPRCQSPQDPSDFVAVCDRSQRIGRCALAPKL